jgi:hypothetical protein
VTIAIGIGILVAYSFKKLLKWKILIPLNFFVIVV